MAKCSASLWTLQDPIDARRLGLFSVWLRVLEVISLSCRREFYVRRESVAAVHMWHATAVVMYSVGRRNDGVDLHIDLQLALNIRALVLLSTLLQPRVYARRCDRVNRKSCAISRLVGFIELTRKIRALRAIVSLEYDSSGNWLRWIIFSVLHIEKDACWRESDFV